MSTALRCFQKQSFAAVEIDLTHIAEVPYRRLHSNLQRKRCGGDIFRFGPVS